MTANALTLIIIQVFLPKDHLQKKKKKKLVLLSINIALALRGSLGRMPIPELVIVDIAIWVGKGDTLIS